MPERCFHEAGSRLQALVQLRLCNGATVICRTAPVGGHEGAMLSPELLVFEQFQAGYRGRP